MHVRRNCNLLRVKAFDVCPKMPVGLTSVDGYDEVPGSPLARVHRLACRL